ncbi:hypothetical protein EVAR_43669_1 [Eumeta japonica]|uniref:Uncharacterized protein n=1 Tax=Eumeta variegata TaxID=151549 RepID=A0A4C1XTT3_EUMVA|nr:hypothetical protein EVAR_43669_1 [Eumeta japonica]
MCGERHVCAFLERVRAEHKTKTLRNYTVAAIKLLDSRLFAIETDPACREKVASMTRVYDVLHRRLAQCDALLAARHGPTSITNAATTALPALDAPQDSDTGSDLV